MTHTKKIKWGSSSRVKLGNGPGGVGEWIDFSTCPFKSAHRYPGWGTSWSPMGVEVDPNTGIKNYRTYPRSPEVSKIYTGGVVKSSLFAPQNNGDAVDGNTRELRLGDRTSWPNQRGALIYDPGWTNYSIECTWEGLGTYACLPMVAVNTDKDAFSVTAWPEHLIGDILFMWRSLGRDNTIRLTGSNDGSTYDNPSRVVYNSINGKITGGGDIISMTPASVSRSDFRAPMVDPINQLPVNPGDSTPYGRKYKQRYDVINDVIYVYENDVLRMMEPVPEPLLGSTALGLNSDGFTPEGQPGWEYNEEIWDFLDPDQHPELTHPKPPWPTPGNPSCHTNSVKIRNLGDNPPDPGLPQVVYGPGSETYTTTGQNPWWADQVGNYTSTYPMLYGDELP